MAITLPLAVGIDDAAAEARPIYRDKVVASLPGRPATTDPVSAARPAEVTLARLVFDTLYRVREGQVEPHLALFLPAVDRVGNRVRIRIRPGVRFHSDRVLTPDDVARSLNRARRARHGLLSVIQSARVEGDEVVLELSRVVDDLPTLLSTPAASITPGGQMPGAGQLIGSGPFRVETIDDRRQLIKLVAFEHFAGRPYADRLELRWFERAEQEARNYESGGAHVSLRGAIAFSGHRPKYRTVDFEGSPAMVVYVAFGRRHRAILKNRDFRAAVSLAMDRSSMRFLGSGETVTAADDPVPSFAGGPRRSTASLRARASEAKAALARARKVLPELRRTSDISFTLVVDKARPEHAEVAGKVLAGLFKLGLRAGIEVVSTEEFARRRRLGEGDFFVDQLVAPLPTQVGYLAAAFAAGGRGLGTAFAARGIEVTSARTEFRSQLPIVVLYHRAVRAHHRSDLRMLRQDKLGNLIYEDAFFFGAPRRN